MLYSVFEVPVGIRRFGDAIIIRVTVDGEFCYGEFCSILGAIEWVRYNKGLLLDQPKRFKEETISEIASRISEYLEAA